MGLYTSSSAELQNPQDLILRNAWEGAKNRYQGRSIANFSALSLILIGGTVLSVATIAFCLLGMFGVVAYSVTIPLAIGSVVLLGCGFIPMSVILISSIISASKLKDDHKSIASQQKAIDQDPDI